MGPYLNKLDNKNHDVQIAKRKIRKLNFHVKKCEKFTLKDTVHFISWEKSYLEWTVERN